MNYSKTEVIGIDHGWSMMKTVSQVFITGAREIRTEPAVFDDVLELDGRYYKIGTQRQEVKDTKTEDESFLILTYASIAKELRRRGKTEVLCETVPQGEDVRTAETLLCEAVSDRYAEKETLQSGVEIQLHSQF